jgi:hypothetical protein
MLRVHRVDREDCPCQVGERLQQLPHRGDFIRFLLHCDLPRTAPSPCASAALPPAVPGGTAALLAMPVPTGKPGDSAAELDALREDRA